MQDGVDTFSPADVKNLLFYCYKGKTFHINKCSISSSVNDGTIEVSGMPMSYKSTLVLDNTVYFRTKGIKTDFIKERTSPINKRIYPTHYSLFISHKTIELLLQMNKDNIYLLDRGVYDQLAFLETYFKLGLIDERTFKLARNYLIKFMTNKIRGIVICQSRPDDCLRREGNRLMPGFVMNPEFLNELYKSYEELPNQIAIAREVVGLGNEPFPLCYLSSGIEWSEYKKLFTKATSTMLSLCNYS